VTLIGKKNLLPFAD